MNLRRWLPFLVFAGSPSAACKPADPPAKAQPVSDLDAGTLKALADAGSDLARPHPIDIYLYFPAQSAAEAAALALRNDGHAVEVRKAAKGVEWLCLAQRTFVPTPAAIQAMRTRMEAIAREHGGEFDGWEAQIMR